MTSASDRLLTMDALRGFAVMGILLLNIIGFSMPEAAYVNPAAWGGTGAADIAAWFFAFVLFDGKMRGLFSLLFGASMLLIIERAELAGRDGHRVHMVRATWLFLFGMLHCVLLWWGDILMTYALVSFVALLFVGKEAPALLKWSFGAFLLHFLIVAGVMASAYAYRHAISLPSATPDMIEGYQAMTESFGAPGSPEIVHEITLYRSGFGTIVSSSLTALTAQFTTLLYFLFDTLGFMLLGMAMLKGGFLTGRWPLDQYRAVARRCFLFGLPPAIALALWVIVSGYDPLVAFGTAFAWSFPFRIPMTVGYAALFMVLILSTPDHPLIRRIAAAGRMAFSNYLGTSLVMCAIFYGWGLGLFGHVSRAQAYLFVFGMWAVMLLWSQPWLTHFRYGPLEWLWRSLARGSFQPMPVNRK